VTGFPTIQFYKNGFEREEGVKYQGNRDIKHLEKFCSEQLGLENSDVNHGDDSDEAVVEDGLYTLTSTSFDSVVDQGDTFIEFYAPWSAQCQRLARIWDDLAKSFEKDEQVKIAEVDCIQYPDICRRQEVKGYPSLLYFRCMILYRNCVFYTVLEMEKSWICSRVHALWQS
jgi:thiol-disulfide isomerase/thioredoxin